MNQVIIFIHFSSASSSFPGFFTLTIPLNKKISAELRHKRYATSGASIGTQVPGNARHERHEPNGTRMPCVKRCTLPETNIAPENGPLEKEIPIGNHHF